MYAIAILKHVYPSDLQGDEFPKFVVDHDDDFILYETFADAMAAIEEMTSNGIVLEHNEYAAPDYIVVEDSVADYIYSGRNGDLSNYAWDDAACTCGECQQCLRMMIEQDRDYIRSSQVRE